MASQGSLGPRAPAASSRRGVTRPGLSIGQPVDRCCVGSAPAVTALPRLCPTSHVTGSLICGLFQGPLLLKACGRGPLAAKSLAGMLRLLLGWWSSCPGGKAPAGPLLGDLQYNERREGSHRAMSQKPELWNKVVSSKQDSCLDSCRVERDGESGKEKRICSGQVGRADPWGNSLPCLSPAVLCFCCQINPLSVFIILFLTTAP